MKAEDWLKARDYTPEKIAIARHILEEARRGRDLRRAVRSYPLPGSEGHAPKHLLIAVYRSLVESGEWPDDPAFLARLRMKPVRSLSGVSTVTVLTKPHPCPGECIFCPDDVRMPKSYIIDEPAAARAYQNDFDPYAQVSNRLMTLEAVGHPTDKMELLILGGSWTAYRRDYQEWFVRRCFDALNEVDSASLEEAQRRNEDAPHRNVGLVVETRPDEITWEQLAWLRRLGVTKVQMGAQSLDNRILALNRRGHTAAETARACAMLRAAAFKIVLHWMPNLVGATPQSDRHDFYRLWLEADAANPASGCCPDEIKIYPCQLLENTPLYQLWEAGQYAPYTTAELVGLIADIKPSIPPYCRVNRVIRDIPSHHVIEGNRVTSLREDALAELKRRGGSCGCIRCREVRGQAVEAASLHLEDFVYHPAYAEEHFLHYLTPDQKIAGYLRLSLPSTDAPQPDPAFTGLHGAALIREVHIYGQALAVGDEQSGAAQHSGLGTALIEKAAAIARQNGYQKMAVIAAIGTRRYYEARGFHLEALYMVKGISDQGLASIAPDAGCDDPTLAGC